MGSGIWTEEDREISEQAIENSLQYFRSTDVGKTSPYKRNHHRKVIINEMEFLREEFPESYILNEDLTDISLEFE